MDAGVAAVVLSSVAILVSVCTLIVAVCTLRKVSTQTDLLRRQIFGEIYDQAQVTDLVFYLPASTKHPVNNELQKEQEEIVIGNSITIISNSLAELHIRWESKESQTLRNFVVGFVDQAGLQKPNIHDRVNPFVQKSYERLPREEYIDWHGFYHCEYGYARRLARGDCHVTCLKVFANDPGAYKLNIEIQVFEAAEPFRADLDVHVTKPDTNV